jgi:hypothetical protein
MATAGDATYATAVSPEIPKGLTMRRFIRTTDEGTRSSPAACRASFTQRRRFRSWSRTGAYGSNGNAKKR